MQIKTLTRLSLLTAAALSLFFIEALLPSLLPVPGVKLGLANIITVYAVYCFGVREAALILLARIILGAIGSGQLMTLPFSMAGGAACLLGMLLLKSLLSQRWLWLAGAIGAVLHNLGQMLIAVHIIGWAIIGYLPLLLLTGAAAGAFTGGCIQLLLSQRVFLKWRYDYL